MSGIYSVSLSESVPDNAPAEDFADPPKGLYVGDARHAALAVEAVTAGLEGNKHQGTTDAQKGKIASAINKFYSGAERDYYLTWLHTGKKPDHKPMTQMYIPTPRYTAVEEQNFPDVPLLPGIDMKRLTKGDDNPIFVVRPLAILGAVSDNGLEYDSQMLDDIQRQIAEKRPPARRGHISEANRNFEFPPDEGYWIGVLRDNGEVFGKPTVFGKCFLMPGTPLHEMIQARDATGTPISNSIWGDAALVDQENGLMRSLETDIESIDFVPPERAALKALGGKFDLTSEMRNQTMADEKGQLTDAERHSIAEAHIKECSPAMVHEMLTPDQRKHVTETTIKALPSQETHAMLAETTRKAVAEAYCKEGGLKMVKEDDIDESDKKSVAEMTSMRTRLSEMESTLKRYEREDFDRALNGAVDHQLDWKVSTEDGQKKLTALKANLRVQVVAEMAGSTKKDDIAAAAGRAWETFKPLAEMTRAALAGPSAISGVVSSGGDGNKFGFDPATGRYTEDAVNQATTRANYRKPA